MAEASESRENGMQAESGGLDPRREGENLARFRELACCPNPFYTGFMPDRAIEIKVNTDVASARDGIAALKQTIEEAAQAAAAMNDTLAATGSALDTGSAGTAYADLADSARQASDALNELMGKASELETALAELDGSMPDFTEGVAALESLQSSMEIVVEIQQKVAAAAEEIDPNLPWEEFDGKMQSVVEVYTEVEATIIRTAEAVVASEESQQAAAEKKAAAVIAAYQKENAQVTQSLGELKAQLEEYKRKMEEAAAAGDKIGQANAIKGIEEMTGKITALGKAQEQSAGRAFGMISGFKNLFAMFATGQVSARGLIVSIKSIGTAIKTGLGPVGWAILIVEALCAAFNKLIDWVKGWGTAAEDEAKRAGDAFKKTVEEAKQAEEDLKKLREKMDSESGVRSLEDYRLYRAREITEEYDKQTARIEKQYRLAKYGLDEEYDKTEHEYNIKALDLKKQAADEGWSRQRLNDALEANEISRTMALNVNKEAQAHAEVVKQTRLETEEKDRLKQIRNDYEKANKGLGSENSQYLKQYRDEVEVLAKKYESLKKIEAIYDPERMADMERLYGKWDGTDGSMNGLSTKQENRLARNLGISLEEFRNDPALVREKMNDIRGQVDSLRDLPKVTQQLNDIADKTGIDATDNDGNLNAEKLVKVYSERVDMSIKLSEEMDRQNKKIAAATQAKEGAEHKEKMTKLDSSQFRDISAATQSAKTAERKRAITDFRDEKEREDAIRKATDKELQGMLKQLSDLLATQVNDPEEYKKTQGQIDEINAQIKKRQQDAEKEQKKREKIEAKARKEATTKKQVEQLGWVIDKVEGTLSSDADLGTKLNQLGEVTNKITKDKSQITDELLEYVKSGLEQLAEAAKNQQAQASKLAAISKQLDATNTALAAAQKQIKSMPH